MPNPRMTFCFSFEEEEKRRAREFEERGAAAIGLEAFSLEGRHRRGVWRAWDDTLDNVVGETC